MWRVPTALLIFGLGAGCATPLQIEDVPSENQSSRIQVVVLHFTSENHAEGLRLLTDSSYGAVSAHYLIPDPRDPTWGRDEATILRLVPEQRRAWHAGLSRWGTRSALNDSSIGIEIGNESRCETPAGMNRVLRPEDRDCTFVPFDPAQIDAVERLLLDILARNPDIDPEDVVAHADITPSRRVDPGPLFPWKRLHEAGIGPWYREADRERHLNALGPGIPDIAFAQRVLSAWGYDLEITGALDPPTRFVLEAFQMRFRANDHAGKLDAETIAIALALTERYRPDAYATLIAGVPRAR
ncbi:MAG: N-acetylmuramoyl-L-alanine amidase [Pseudomonadales bacterium]|nr:N-acetylmuramoyl-L-alanine amidase [Pseudomonadales bacterium]